MIWLHTLLAMGVFASFVSLFIDIKNYVIRAISNDDGSGW